MDKVGEYARRAAVRYAILVVFGRPYLTPNWPF